MPLYEYECEACGHRFEVIQKYSDAPLETCEKCGGTVRKLLSSPAIQFKGTGWYITDYARAGKSEGDASAAKSDSSASSTAGKSETKADSKSETKSESKSEGKSDTKATPSTST